MNKLCRGLPVRYPIRRYDAEKWNTSIFENDRTRDIVYYYTIYNGEDDEFHIYGNL